MLESVRRPLPASPRRADGGICRAPSPSADPWPAGLALGRRWKAVVAGAARLRGRIVRPIRSRNQLAAATGLPVLGRLPLDLPGQLSTGRCPTALDYEALPAILYHAPKSAAAAAFMGILNLVRPGVGMVGRRRAVMVTAIAEGDGKSTVALGLALAAAAGGERVLLLDGVGLARQVGGRGGPAAGPARAATGASPIGAALLAVPGTSVVALRPYWGNLPALASPSPRAVADLFESADEFSTIVIDGPLLGPNPWLQAVAGGMDRVLVVARSGRTDGRRLGEAVSHLSSAGRRVCTGVLASG